MTISSTTRKAGPYTGNGSASAFPFAFKVFAASDLYVVKTNTTLGADSVLTLGSDYTVALNADQNANPGGTITLTAGVLATGYKLTITSSLQYLQPTDLTNQGGFYPSVITNALDRLTIFCQQLYEQVTRSLKVSVSTPAGVSTTLPPPSANKLIGWNATADNLQNMDPQTLATIVAFGTANADKFSGDGTTTQFVLSANPGALNNLDVSISGVTQKPGIDYTWNTGTTVTFTTAPPSGTNNILVRYMQGLPQGYTTADLVQYTAASGGAATTLLSKLGELKSINDFGAVGNGVADDTAAFVAAANTNVPILLEEKTYKVTQQIIGRFVSFGKPSYTGGGFFNCDCLSPVPSSGAFNNNGIRGFHSVQSSFLLLGDSISEGVGASVYTGGYSWQVARSILNATDKGFPNERGYGYHTVINAANSTSSTGISTTGSYVNAGVVGSRLSLAAGQTITITGRAFNFCDVVYDASSSSGSLEFRLNGTLIATKALSGSGYQNTFATSIKTDSMTAFSDTVTITATGGTAVITAIWTWRQAGNSPAAYVVAKSGTAYQDYTTTAAMDELAYYLNAYRSGNLKYMMLALGTNNIYNAGKALSPAAMIAQIDTLITGMSSRCTLIKFVLAVPPRAVESTWPVIVSGYQYEDYVDAIVGYAKKNGHALIRHDQSLIASQSSSLFSDGVHPNDVGHFIMAGTACDALGIPFNGTTYNSTGDNIRPAELLGTQVDITMNGTWRPFTNASTYRAVVTKAGNQIVLSGIVEPNGSASTTLGTLPAGYRPQGRNTYTVTRDNAGAQMVTINTDGTIVLNSVPSTWVSLENIVLTISRP